MLKSQDIVLLLKLFSHPNHLNWTQQQLATHLCLSSATVHAILLRLEQSKLVYLGFLGKRYSPVIVSCEEVLIHGVKYFFPAKMGTFSAGIPTSYAAPIFEKLITIGEDPIPIWPSAYGNRKKGIILEPLHYCVPDSLVYYPDQSFYELLVLLDALRQGRARERNMAKEMLKERLGLFKNNR